MSRTLVIIRTCLRDDNIAYLCYHSFKQVMDADYLFFAEQADYKWISITGVPIIYRDCYDNFGGQIGLHGFIKEASLIDVSKYDTVIVSDSDITMLKNPLQLNFEFGGVKSETNERHYSGQLLIYSNEVWNRVMSYTKYNELIEKFVNSGTIDVADDTCMSWVATEFTNDTFDFHEKGYWIHEKNYHLEPPKKGFVRLKGTGDLDGYTFDVKPWDALNDLK